MVNIGNCMGLWASKVGEADSIAIRKAIESGEIDKLADAFYCDLAFGTGGLRGKLGIGPNRMNRFTVGKATQGLADYLNNRFESPSVVLCRDSRNGGEEFVRRAAEVFAANGVTVFIFPRIEPTPALSFAVRDLGCSAGINITASHNPAEYNGYKVYGPDGCQITVEMAKDIQAHIDSVDIFDGVKRASFSNAERLGLISYVDEGVIDRYCEAVLCQSTGIECSDLSVVYTPLNGAGLECVLRVLRGVGIEKIDLVQEQVQPNGDFPTCPYPNPEVREALSLGLSLCDLVHPDLLLATDPDADRVGIAVHHEGDYRLLSGNEVGLLLLDYLASRAIAKEGDISGKVAMSTIVSTPMADDIALEYGFELRRTLTGFKFIGEQVGLLAAEGRAADFLFGFEESYGYLTGTYVRDKDAVVASMLICELASWWKGRGFDLYEAMQLLYERYGFWASELLSVSYEGPNGAKLMRAIMHDLRASCPVKIADRSVESSVDYSAGAPMPVVNARDRSRKQELPKSDVMEFRLLGGSRILIRPSGTEPKIKAYVFARGETLLDAKELLFRLVASANELLRP